MIEPFVGLNNSGEVRIEIIVVNFIDRSRAFCYPQRLMGHAMMFSLRTSLASLVAFTLLLWGGPSVSFAIVVDPSKQQVEEALKKGKDAAEARKPPNQVYWQFGAQGRLEPHGFLMTKIGGIAVMATHFALRAEAPSHDDIQQMVEQSSLQVSVTIFGSSPAFARDSYVLLKQDGRLIKPKRVRSDAQAARSSVWPASPAYRAKVVASFPYGTFDPMIATVVSVFPGEGGEISFDLDFSSIP